MTKKEWTHQKYEEDYKPAFDAFIPLYPFTTENLDGERWLPVPQFEEVYHCSNFGRVKSFWGKEPKILTPKLHTGGYLQIVFYKNGKAVYQYIHRLVAELFISNPLNLPEVNHDDGVKFNCYVENLYWSTSSENKKHAFATGLAPQGEDRPDAKLTDEQVRYIRNNPDELNLEQLAEKFGVVRETIGRIQRGKTYKNAGGPIREKIDNRIDDEKRAQILARYQAGGISQRELARQFGVNHKTISNIIHGK